jgi:hypothetical protein
VSPFESTAGAPLPPVQGGGAAVSGPGRLGTLHSWNCPPDRVIAELRSPPDRGSRCSPRPVTASVDMTSTVKYHDGVGGRRRVLAVDRPPRWRTTDSVSAAGGYRHSVPLAIVDCGPSTASVFRRSGLPGPRRQGARALPREGRCGGERGVEAGPSWGCRERSSGRTRAFGGTESVTTTADHADIRGFGYHLWARGGRSPRRRPPFRGQ